jgi:crotonobetainyl-CoA:carnitine CoA-transferase CaiB-like acyl-CoA transferase
MIRRAATGWMSDRTALRTGNRRRAQNGAGFMTQAPLAGIRVVESGQVLAAPLAGMVFADLGAHVTKIERPLGGDPSRGFGPPFIDGDAYYYHSLNRNKVSLTLDLRTDADRQRLYQLIADSDVFVHNHVEPAARKLGVDESSIRAANPDIIYVAIAAYGGHDSRNELQSLDMLIQAESGAMAMTGWADRPPVKAAVPIADVVAGLYAVITGIASLRARAVTGEAADCSVSLLDSTIASLPFHWGDVFFGGRDPARRGNGHPTIVPYNTYPARAERYVALAVVNERQWQDCCSALGLPLLASDPALQTNAGRVAARDKIDTELSRAIAGRNANDVVAELRAVRVPVSMVRTPSEVIAAMATAQSFVPLPPTVAPEGPANGPDGADLLVPGPPYTISGVRPVRPQRAPRLGTGARATAEPVDAAQGVIGETEIDIASNEGRS